MLSQTSRDDFWKKGNRENHPSSSGSTSQTIFGDGERREREKQTISSGAGVVFERRMPRLYSACNRHILVALLRRSPSYPPADQSERWDGVTSPPVARARLGGGRTLPSATHAPCCHQLLFTCCGLGGNRVVES
ncbi:hypothetical protein CDAR_422241 [Caerostris darwini]|uniref:Uncharacterized protein n=1 Tax=Caerostris darwini TaxID=1538125 RepID=A0AAV4WSN0_9ARAC|nr:hypothetical protein CDAR_422241 [Caerostris darwini]